LRWPAGATLTDHSSSDRENMKIERDGRRLLLHAERNGPEREGSTRASTRSSGHLHHEVVLFAEVDRDGIQASLEQGVPTVRLPKNEQSQRHTIDNRRSSTQGDGSQRRVQEFRGSWEACRRRIGRRGNAVAAGVGPSLRP